MTRRQKACALLIGLLVVGCNDVKKTGDLSDLRVEAEAAGPINILRDKDGNMLPEHFASTNWKRAARVGGKWYRVHVDENDVITNVSELGPDEMAIDTPAFKLPQK